MIWATVNGGRCTILRLSAHDQSRQRKVKGGQAAVVEAVWKGRRFSTL
jgi:hypothetical protein